MTADEEKISVLIVDDHRLLREGVRTYLELHDDIEVVGEAEEGASGRRAGDVAYIPTSSSWISSCQGSMG